MDSIEITISEGSRLYLDRAVFLTLKTEKKIADIKSSRTVRCEPAGHQSSYYDEETGEKLFTCEVIATAAIVKDEVYGFSLMSYHGQEAVLDEISDEFGFDCRSFGVEDTAMITLIMSAILVKSGANMMVSVGPEDSIEMFCDKFEFFV